MCGIAGIIGEEAGRHKAAVERMLASMEHRGPDHQGLWVSLTGRCVLGHRRLAILDLTEKADQPMTTPDGRFAFVYNGECYNFRELRVTLERRGEAFKSTGDAEVVLRWLAHADAKGLPRLNGMFAFAMWDEAQQAVLLARDRFGQKPLYYARCGPLLVFASEVRAILASGLVERRLDPAGVCSYLSYGAVQGPGTIVRGVSLLPRAAYRRFAADGKEESGTYWLPVSRKGACGPAEVRERLAAAVERHLVSDVPVCVFLSAGLDSAALLAAAVRVAKGPAISITVAFPDSPQTCEAEKARALASSAGAAHREIAFTEQDMARLAPQVLGSMDQPTSDGINTYVVSHAARAVGLKAALSGLGGDELFGGYPSFRDVPRMVVFQHLARVFHNPLSTLLRGHVSTANRFSKWLDLLAAPADLLSAYLVRRRLFSSRQLEALVPTLVGQARWHRGLAPEYVEELVADIRGVGPWDAVSRLEMDLYMGQTLLRDSDVMGMANSVEIRLPYLDAEFADGVQGVAKTSPLRPGRAKKCLRDAMSQWLPPGSANTRKQAFTLPLEAWMLGRLRGEVEEGLTALGILSGVFNAPFIQRLWRDFCSRPKRVGWLRIWSLFALARFIQRHRLCL